MIFKKRAARRPLRKKRVYRKKGRRLPMYKAIKRAAVSACETKRQIWTVASNDAMSVGSLYAMNPLYQNIQGTADGQHIGDEIYLKGLGVRCLVSSPAASTATDWYFNIALVRSRQQLNDIGDQNFNSTTISNFIQNSAQHNPLWFTNSEKCTVIRHRTFKITPGFSGVYNSGVGAVQIVNNQRTVQFRMYVPFKAQKFQYDSTTGFGKFVNYYWICWWGGAYGITGDCTFTCTGQTYYKDP